ncbi:Uncharacterized protein GBIM_01976 [Gryllus bimaculatus]|nr:Uncharacterized protein GBIM_01976 [Gryllus bimaculatus]
MAYRGITDPFTPKTTRNERFAQMSRQEQLIEQKKREIQAKLEEQKKKEATEALKKFQSAGTTKTSPGSKVNPPSTQSKGGRKSFWKSDQRWKKETSYTDDSSSKSNSVNIFNNDGSFLDQFRKLSGVKDSKIKREEDTPHSLGFDSRPSGSSEGSKRESDTDWGTWNATENQTSVMERENPLTDRRNSHGERDQDKDELLQNSERLGTAHWFQSHTQEESSNWQGQSNSPPPSTVPRPSSPYSPTRATTDPPQTPEKPAIPILNPLPQFQQPPLHPTATLPPLTSAPPPNLLQRPPVQPFISYTAPPPPIHAVQPAQLPPPTVPPPTLAGVQGAPAVVAPSLPASLSVPPPTQVLQHAIPPTAVPPSNPPTLAPQILPPPALLQQPPIGPPPILPQGLPPPGTLPPTVPSSVLANAAPVIQTAIPPPPIPTAVMSVAHAIPPPCVPLSVPGAAMAGVTAAPGTGAAPLAPDPAEEEATTHLARMVAQCGDDIEEIIKVRNPDDKNLFLHSKNSTAYIQYRCLVDKFRAEMKKDEKESTDRKEDINNKNIIQDLQSDCRNDSNINEYGSVKQEIKSEPSDEYSYKRDIKREHVDDENSRHSEGKRSGDDSDEGALRRRKRRSRWAPESEKVELAAPAIASVAVGGKPAPAPGPPSHLLTKISRTDPALIQYAIQAFGTKNLSEEDWKKAEDHYKINLLYQDMMRKRQEVEQLQRQGKFKYEYDSDEETDGGTWEHRLRLAEMEATQLWAEELTKKAEGKHHIGDFLPPDELERFMEKYSALKEGREPDLSDYKEFKLKEDNIGFQMLQKLGWSEGQGLGTDGAGIVDPVNKASTRPENQGLGLERPEDVSKGDDEYDAYRKRMMLAYRFRPNPLNNPRRPYY